MNGRDLTLVLVGALAVAGAVRRRGSAAIVGRLDSAAIVGRLDPERLRYDKRLALAARAQLAARGVTVPAPTTVLGTGSDARVFNTTRKGIVVRVGRGRSVEKQSLLLDEDFEGGVVPVLAMTEIDGHVVSWKERVDTDVEGFLTRAYGGHDDARFREIVRALVGLYHTSGANLAILSRYPETKGLARAIRRGLPTDDIDLTLNLGVTKDGRVVAYDL
jgi:hypothetical protein